MKNLENNGQKVNSKGASPVKFLWIPIAVIGVFLAWQLYGQFQYQRKIQKLLKQHQVEQNDNDHDGVENIEEQRVGTNPNKADTDGDGLSDFAELPPYSMYKTDPLKADTDGDGIPDGQEIANKTNPLGSGPVSEEQLRAWGVWLGNPIISNVRFSFERGRATITWETDKPSISYFTFGGDPHYGMPTPQEKSLQTIHSGTIPPKGYEQWYIAGKTYHYQIFACIKEDYFYRSDCNFTPDATFVAQ